MNPTFIKYEANQTPESQRGPYDPIGIATIGLFNNAIVLRYTIKPGKEGKGFYISEFSQKLNGEWNKSHTVDSNVAKEEIESLIKRNLTQKTHYEKPTVAQPKVYQQTNFGTEECPF